jgi:hypothetical protein
MKTKLEYTKKSVGHSGIKPCNHKGFDLALIVLGVKFVPTSNEKSYAKK